MIIVNFYEDCFDTFLVVQYCTHPTYNVPVPGTYQVFLFNCCVPGTADVLVPLRRHASLSWIGDERKIQLPES
jgi:hypothetical protein